MSDHDVLIAGGGPAGAATALALRARGRSVLLVEGSRYEGFRIGETLAPYARVLLEKLGAWSRFEADGHRPAYAVHAAWGGDELVPRDFIFDPYGAGWALDRRRFDAMLADAATAAGAGVLTGARVVQVTGSDGCFTAAVEHDGQRREHRARFVVDATGRGGLVACSLGARRVAFDRLLAVARVLGPREGGADPGDVLVLESSPEGWWYSVPLPGGALLAAFLTDGDRLAQRGLAPEALWSAEIARTVHTRARAEGRAPREDTHVFKAATSCLDRAAGPGWAAIGDAASAYDPLSAQGISKALEAALTAGAAIDAHLDGDPAPLHRYAAGVAEGFSKYRTQRTRFYAAETRFRDALFWQRRRAPDPDQMPIRLDPRAQVVATSAGADAAARVEALLPPAEIERLARLCAAPVQAADAARAFREGAPIAWSDREIVLALQAMLEAGLLARAGLAGQ